MCKWSAILKIYKLQVIFKASEKSMLVKHVVLTGTYKPEERVIQINMYFILLH